MGSSQMAQNIFISASLPGAGENLLDPFFVALTPAHLPCPGDALIRQPRGGEDAKQPTTHWALFPRREVFNPNDPRRRVDVHARHLVGVDPGDEERVRDVALRALRAPRRSPCPSKRVDCDVQHLAVLVEVMYLDHDPVAAPKDAEH